MRGEFLVAMPILNKKEIFQSCNLTLHDSKLFFFASDNSGGKFAFKTDVEDNQVYYLPNFPLDQIIVYDSFINLVKQKIKEAT